jgi:hypothetical protein
MGVAPPALDPPAGTPWDAPVPPEGAPPAFDPPVGVLLCVAGLPALDPPAGVLVCAGAPPALDPPAGVPLWVAGAPAFEPPAGAPCEAGVLCDAGAPWDAAGAPCEAAGAPCDTAGALCAPPLNAPACPAFADAPCLAFTPAPRKLPPRAPGS